MLLGLVLILISVPIIKRDLKDDDILFTGWCGLCVALYIDHATSPGRDVREARRTAKLNWPLRRWRVHRPRGATFNEIMDSPISLRKQAKLQKPSYSFWTTFFLTAYIFQNLYHSKPHFVHPTLQWNRLGCLEMEHHHHNNICEYCIDVDFRRKCLRLAFSVRNTHRKW